MSNRTELKRMFGSFWNKLWKDEDFYNALLNEVDMMFDRLMTRTADLPDFTSRFTIPVKKRTTTRYSSISEISLSRKYTVVGSYLMNQGRRLDELQSAPPVWESDAPVENCYAITDSPVNPDLILIRGTHFDIRNGRLEMYVDPFQEAFRQHLIVENDEQVKLADIWFVHTEDDANYLSDHYGRVIGMLTPSTRYYKRILNAIYDMLQEGATANRFALFLGSIVDTDVAKIDGDITHIWDEGGRSWIAIGDEVHSCPGEGRVTVSVGDTVEAGDILFDTFSVTRGKESIDPGDFPQITLGPAFIETPSGYSLTFENADVEVTDYKFPIGGVASDVTAFWAAAEAEAATRGIDLQEAIIGDQRTPYVVNPFDIIRANFLASAVVFITLDLSVVPDQEAIKLLRYLDTVLPGSTTYILNVFGFTDEETVPQALTDQAEPFSVGEGNELDNLTITDYVIGNEKLY